MEAIGSDSESIVGLYPEPDNIDENTSGKPGSEVKSQNHRILAANRAIKAFRANVYDQISL